MYIQIKQVRIYPAVILLTSMLGSVASPVYADEVQREQTFVITAYYSPLPNQCCYVLGSYEEDIAFNGNGTHGADGTAVYPGMIAAPESYPFGTVIELPGIGIGTVHDRGSMIVEWTSDVHRIDLWLGAGEEGLARALLWGTRTVKGIVYSSASEKPAEDWLLSRFDANPAVLAWLPKSDPVRSVASVSLGDKAYSVRLLQESLRKLGYFERSPTGTFGPVTQEALRAFAKDYGLPGDGSSVGALASAVLLIAAAIEEENLPEVDVLSVGASGDSVRQAQKLLRYLGHYRGRTDGVYDSDLREAVLDFQLKSGVIQAADSAGSGRIGPKTREAIRDAWKEKVVLMKAEALVSKNELAAEISNALPKRTLSRGDHGEHVEQLQQFLRDANYLPPQDVTGTFGERTEAAVMKYQLDRKIVESPEDHGAGVFGPATRLAAVSDAVAMEWNRVRSGAM